MWLRLPCRRGNDSGLPPLSRVREGDEGDGKATADRLRSSRKISPVGSARSALLKGVQGTRILDFSKGFVCMPTHQRIDVSKVGDVTVVRFNDRKILDEAKIIQFGTELFSLVDLDNRKSILLNFDGVEFLSSAALGKLITLDRKVKSHKGRLKMSNIRREIYDVFLVTKLNKVFDIHDGEAEALSAF